MHATPVRLGRSPLALRVRFDDGSGFSLTEAGTRRRLAVHVVTDPHLVPAIATLGIEPLSEGFTVDRLGELLAARRQQVKGLLRDQGTIAGIGNAYSDEILHAARLSPFTPTTSSRTPSDGTCACTVAQVYLAPAGTAPRAATPFTRSRSRTPRSSTAPRARPAVARSRTDAARACCAERIRTRSSRTCPPG